jgi:hypothetical protein
VLPPHSSFSNPLLQPFRIQLILSQDFPCLTFVMVRKKSLLIGINYTGSQNELRGCHQDVENVAEFISYRGFPDDPRSQVILRDDAPGSYYLIGHNILVNLCKYPSSVNVYR